MSTRHRATFCNHYRAMFDHETCAAGVPYSKFSGMGHDKMPCFRKRGEEPRPGCELAEHPTAEQIAAADAEIAARFANTMKAREAIVAHLGGPWKKGTAGASGQIDCPVCETGKLKFSRASYNGHIHAGCTTPDCVRWME